MRRLRLEIRQAWRMRRPPKMRWAGRRTKSWMASRSARRPPRAARLLRPATHARRTHAKLSLGQACVSASSFSPDTDTCVPTRIAIDFCGREQNPAAAHPVSLPANPVAAPAGSGATGGAPRCERPRDRRPSAPPTDVSATDGTPLPAATGGTQPVTGSRFRHRHPPAPAATRYGRQIPPAVASVAGGDGHRIAIRHRSPSASRRKRRPSGNEPGR